MTGNNIADRVRKLLDDEDDPKWWTPDTLVMWLNDGVDLIVNLRSDALLDTDGTMITITEITGLANTISISAQWRDPLVDYLTSRCLEMYAGQKFNRAKAKHHFDRFMAVIKT